ncbi:LCP family protein [Stackebrandtia nassauensis]|uniref:Cell envelope-related transcriptional attenuator n=1 Tax=Stackebrandtia nassauensis (strain DSM 44728 / CIP 108903 / NRRL B-16338 / NBRC 102104 / LLR-40K-21) TaxID=446470 RepID=D3Q450_STANL|nr:LCP family protein [Stackebrandtia nassauensis]ADD45935.1 cell envelope-related transcriptional attenuator [Stackebrandtia nassauensis DSM 44728]
MANDASDDNALEKEGTGDDAPESGAPDLAVLPAKKTKTGAPWWAKVMVGVGAVLMVAAGGGAVYAKVMLDRINNAGTEKNLLGDGDSQAGEDIKGPLNLLMIGTDMRVNDSDKIDRADSIMILHINKDLTKANIISVPRDLKVPCNDEPEGTCYTKVNGTYADGGETQEERFQGLAESLSTLTGIKQFDGAAIIGFEGFLKAVKVLGSVELCLPMDMQLHHQMKEQPNKPRTFKKGCHEYNQREALWIVRERYAYSAENPDFDPDWGVGDYGRQHMQQHFIKQLLKKASEEGYITNPTKVGDLIDAVGSTLTYHFRGHTPVDMAFALRGVKPNSMKTVRLPSETSMEGGESFEVIPEGKPLTTTEELFKALREDTMDEWIAENPKLLNKD